VKVCSEALKCADRLAITIRRHGSDVKRRPYVQAGRIRVHQGQLSLTTLPSFPAFHLFLLWCDQEEG
jgi:hypothetical protein